MSSFVTLQHRNVCKDGFSELKDEVDAGRGSFTTVPFDRTIDLDIVFLDLPAPWEAIPHAKVAIRVGLFMTYEAQTSEGPPN